MTFHANTADRVRPPAVADQFYPGEAHALKLAVEQALATAKPPAVSPKALIAPHAGYMYSGPIAGSAFVHWIQDAKDIHRIVLIGPSHRLPFSGLALTSATAYETPLGNVRVDRAAMAPLAELPFVETMDTAHAEEHSLEVELPFLQTILGEFTLLPIVAGDASDSEVAQALELVWGGPETRIVISSDLSHYLDYPSAVRLDHATAQAIESLKPEAIEAHQACGRVPIRGLLTAANQAGLQAQTIDLRNSGDICGARSRVVGYGAFVFA